MTIRAFLKTKTAEKKPRPPVEHVDRPISAFESGPISTTLSTEAENLKPTNPAEYQDDTLLSSTSSKKAQELNGEILVSAEAQIDIPRPSVEVSLDSNDSSTHENANLVTRRAQVKSRHLKTVMNLPLCKARRRMLQMEMDSHLLRG